MQKMLLLKKMLSLNFVAVGLSSVSRLHSYLDSTEATDEIVSTEESLDTFNSEQPQQLSESFTTGWNKSEVVAGRQWLGGKKNQQRKR